MLAVGDSTELEIILNTKRYKNRITKSPRIETNEGTGKKSVKISCHVVMRPDSTHPIVIKPYKLDISQFGEKVRDRMSFNITNVSEQDLTLELIDLPVDLVEVDLPDKIEAGKSAKGELILKPKAIEESFEKSITIELDDQEKSRFTIPIRRVLRIPGMSSSK